jgi:hypothetical protein
VGARGSRARKRCESKRRDASQHDAQDQRRNPPGPHVEARTSRQHPTGRHKSRPPNGPQHSLCSFTVRSPRMLSIRARLTDVAASTLHSANGKVNGPDRQVWSLRSPNLASRSNARPRACENGDCNTRDHARGSAIATVVRAGIKSAVLIGTKTDPTLRTADFPDERASEPAARTRSPWTTRESTIRCLRAPALRQFRRGAEASDGSFAPCERPASERSRHSHRRLRRLPHCRHWGTLGGVAAFSGGTAAGVSAAVAMGAPGRTCSECESRSPGGRRTRCQHGCSFVIETCVSGRSPEISASDPAGMMSGRVEASEPPPPT